MRFPYWFYLTSLYFRAVVCKQLLWFSDGHCTAEQEWESPGDEQQSSEGLYQQTALPDEALRALLIWLWPWFAPSPAHNVIKILTVQS